MAKKYTLSFIQILISALTVIFYSFPVSANIGISTYRLYLDPENTTENFIISNKLDVIQNCSLRFKHYSFDDSGKMLNYEGVELPENSASTLVRFSPKIFHIEPKSSQTVRFTLRRKKDTPAMEYRSFVAVICKPEISTVIAAENEDKNLLKMTMTPILEHVIPLVIRPKKLNAEVKFENIRFEGEYLNFDLLREGDRSVYGKIKVTEKSSDNTITESANLVMYTETTKKSFKLHVGTEYALSDLVITFTESGHNSDALTINWPN